MGHVLTFLKIFNTDKMDLGVKTTRDFRKGEVIAEYSGDLVRTYREYKRRENHYDATGFKGSFQFQFWLKGKRFWFVTRHIRTCLKAKLKFDLFIGFMKGFLPFSINLILNHLFRI